MIRIPKGLQRSAGPEFFAERFQKPQVGKIITRSLEEQHRNLYVEEVLRAVI